MSATRPSSNPILPSDATLPNTECHFTPPSVPCQACGPIKGAAPSGALGTIDTIALCACSPTHIGDAEHETHSSQPAAGPPTPEVLAGKPEHYSNHRFIDAAYSAQPTTDSSPSNTWVDLQNSLREPTWRGRAR
jgi:hypothetical protein